MTAKHEAPKVAKHPEPAGETKAEATARIAGGEEMLNDVTKLEQKNAASLKAMNLPATFPVRGGSYVRHGDKLTLTDGPDKNHKDAA